MKNEFTLKANCGLLFRVYQTESGSWAWVDQRGYGFTNENLPYILEYLAEVCGVSHLAE